MDDPTRQPMLNGHVVWQTFMITPVEAKAGASGVSVWCTPAYDEESNRLFIGTGNNFSSPATANSDAVLALDAGTGRIEWVNQRTPDDPWTRFFPTGPNADFGDSPQVDRLPNGRKVVGVGQKNGVYHILDPGTGGEFNSRRFVPGSTLGGLFSDSAVMDGVAFANGNNMTTGPPSHALDSRRNRSQGHGRPGRVSLSLASVILLHGLSSQRNHR